jgi:hypothetical protein
MERTAKLSDLGAVAAIGLLAFSLSMVWYSPLLFGSVWEEGTDVAAAAPPAWTFAVAPLREILSAAVVLFLVRRTRVRDAKGALVLGLVLWLGFYVVQLAGAVIWDQMPWELGAVHAGDWLVKVLVIAVLAGAWERRIGGKRRESENERVRVPVSGG